MFTTYHVLVKICMEHFGDDIDPDGGGGKSPDGFLLLGRNTKVADIIDGDDTYLPEFVEAIFEETGIRLSDEEVTSCATITDLATVIDTKRRHEGG